MFEFFKWFFFLSFSVITVFDYTKFTIAYYQLLVFCSNSFMTSGIKLDYPCFYLADFVSWLSASNVIRSPALTFFFILFSSSLNRISFAAVGSNYYWTNCFHNYIHKCKKILNDFLVIFSRYWGKTVPMLSKSSKVPDDRISLKTWVRFCSCNFW